MEGVEKRAYLCWENDNAFAWPTVISDAKKGHKFR